jgi:hypothetical protein
MRAVLDLDPLGAPPGAIAAIASLGDDPLKPHDTCLPEDERAVRILDMLRQAEAVLATIQKLGQQGASHSVRLAHARHLRGACRRSSSKAQQRPNQPRHGQGRQEQQRHKDAVNWAEPNSASSAV